MSWANLARLISLNITRQTWSARFLSCVVWSFLKRERASPTSVGEDMYHEPFVLRVALLEGSDTDTDACRDLWMPETNSCETVAWVLPIHSFLQFYRIGTHFHIESQWMRHTSQDVPSPPRHPNLCLQSPLWLSQTAPIRPGRRHTNQDPVGGTLTKPPRLWDQDQDPNWRRP